MKKLLLVLAILVGALMALFYWQRRVPSSVVPAEVAMAAVTRGTLSESVVATGTVKPKVGAEVKVGSQISGVVTHLYVDVGNRVTKGQLLATIDDSALRSRVNARKAALEAAIAEREYAEAQLDRSEKMRDMVARSDVETSRRNLAVRVANIESARADLADSNITLAFARITAPVAGIIGSVSTQEGETVAASFAAPTFVTIVDSRQIEMQARVDETDIGKVHEGSPVSFVLDAFPAVQMEGQVRAIYPKPEVINNVVNYIVIVDFKPASNIEVRPEMTARVNFISAKHANVLTLPRSAIEREGGHASVVMRDHNAWVHKPVRLGLQDTQRVEVLDSVSEGDSVVANVQSWKETQEKRHD